MTKTTIAAGAVLFLAGVAAIPLINRSKENADATREVSGKSGSSFHTSKLTPTKDPASQATRARTRIAVKNPELPAKYGESRTNLSQQITTNIIGLLEATVDVGKMATTGKLGGASVARDGLRLGLAGGANNLMLSDEQMENASAIYSEFQKRELAKSEEAIERLKKDPTSLMQLILANDALSHGDITVEEYKSIQTASGEDLRGVLSPLDERNFRGGRPLKDETFLTEFKAILVPAQVETLQANIDIQHPTSENDQPNEGSIINLPSMGLEKLDATIESVKKLSTGLNHMGGLSDPVPLTDGQPGGNTAGTEE